jgi:dUTP diphosphatase
MGIKWDNIHVGVTGITGDRIAQLLIVPIEKPDVEIVDRLSDSDRGTGGLGSSGR